MTRYQAHNKSGRVDAAGFTLIEVLVVLFIISIVTGMAVLTISHNTNRQMKTFASELSQVISMAEEQAMLEPRVMGLRLDYSKISFANYVKNEKEQASWLPSTDRVFRHFYIPDNVEVTLSMDGKKVSLKDAELPQIIFSTNGDITPFVMYIGKKGERPRFAIQASVDGSVRNIALS